MHVSIFITMSNLVVSTNKHYTHNQQVENHCYSGGMKSTYISMRDFRNSQTEYNLLKLTYIDTFIAMASMKVPDSVHVHVAKSTHPKPVQIPNLWL